MKHITRSDRKFPYISKKNIYSGNSFYIKKLDLIKAEHERLLIII
jgi:hypothetical protein